MRRILIADDHLLFRAGLIRTISENMNNVEFGEAGNEGELLALIEKQKWDIVILDISMPGRSGLDALKEIKSFHPKLPILILSMYPEKQFAVRAIKSGAAGYLTKDSSPKELISAIEKIISGEKYLTPSVVEEITSSLTEDTEIVPHQKLSDREFQVLRMIASGKSVSDIAEELSLSVKTISTYRAHILEKMGMKNNAELIHYAISNKLI